MGGGSETVRSAQISGLSDKHGALKKKILLENGKHIPSGMNMVIKSRGQSIVDIKSMYNKKYLEAMGYAPNDSILVDKLSEGKVLEYTKNNRNSNAQFVSSLVINTLGTLDQAILELQDKPDFKRTEMSFTHTDGKKYYYFTAVQNGSYIDISCYMNSTDTVTPFLVNKYPDGYAILDMNTYPLVNNGSVYWKVDVEYIYHEDEEVNGQIVTLQKLGLVTEYIDCTFMYFTVLDEEEALMYALAQQHSGPFTTTGYYTEVFDDGSLGRSYTVTVYGTFTVTYIGNGEFSYHMNAPVPGGLIEPTKYAWSNGAYFYQETTINSVESVIIDNIRKLIWDYGTDINNLDNIKKTYVTGDILNSFIVKVQADVYPIISLKKWRSFVNNSKMDIVLKKIGIEGKDFRESLSNPYIVDAHLFFGIPFNASNPALVQYIFEFFTTLSNLRENYQKNNQISGMNMLGIVFDPKDKSSSANVEFNGMEIQQNYFVDYEVILGPANRPVGTYWYQEVTETITDYEEVESPGGTGTTRVPFERTVTHKEYCHQESESYYIRIRPSVGGYSYRLNGIRFGPKLRGLMGKKGGSGNDIELRLPIVKQITNKMGFNLLCDLIEQSMSIAYYTEQEVKTKWYQTGFFKFLTAAVMMYFGQYWAIAVMVATEVVIGVFGAKLGGIFAIIVTVVALITQNYGTAFEMTTQNVLMTASQVLSLVSQANNLMFGINIEKKQKNYESILGAQNNEKDKLQEEYEKLHENEGMAVNLFNNVKTLDDISAYYDIALGNFNSNYLMFDYATDYSKFYNT